MKTSELTGAALDWAVAKCEEFDNGDWLPDYSTDWAAGGTIIEREGICVIEKSDRTWTANIYRHTDLDIPLYSEQGTTPLIAAMRCYVASKLGDKVDIPEELTIVREAT
jgi:hypothetical protein